MKLSNKLTILGIIFFNTISCINHHSEINDRLTNGNVAFWDIYDFKKKYIIGSTSFAKDGSCISYNYRQGIRSKLYDDDVVYPHTWNLQGDSILNVQGFNRRILRFGVDSLVLQNIKTGDTIFFIKSKQ